MMLSKSLRKESPGAPRHNVAMESVFRKRGRKPNPNSQANKQTIRPGILRKIAADEDTLDKFMNGGSATSLVAENKTQNPKPKRPVEGRPKPTRPVEGSPKPKRPVEGNPKPKRPVEVSKGQGRGAGKKVSHS